MGHSLNPRHISLRLSLAGLLALGIGGGGAGSGGSVSSLLPALDPDGPGPDEAGPAADADLREEATDELDEPDELEDDVEPSEVAATDDLEEVEGVEVVSLSSAPSSTTTFTLLPFAPLATATPLPGRRGWDSILVHEGDGVSAAA